MRNRKMKGKKMVQDYRFKPMLKAKDQPNLNRKKNKQKKEMEKKRKVEQCCFFFSRDEEKTLKPESIVIRLDIT